MNTVAESQTTALNQLSQLPESGIENPLSLPRYVRWAKAQAEIDALCHTLPLYEFKARQAEAWAKWGL